MYRKTLILFLAVSILIFLPQSKSVEIKGVFQKITHPVTSLFSNKSNSTEENNVDVKEHGNFDFVGRDLVREASKKIKNLGEDIKSMFSKTTQGLDCNRTFSSGVDNFKSKVRAIYPGTKWCGDGNISDSYDDLGKFSSTDKCCRQHDLCPDNIPADSEKYGLVNTGLFTRSHCDCDSEFYNCLKKAKGVVADSIGFTYFTVLGPQCFKEDYPAVRCLEDKKGKCTQYEKDTQSERIFQWFDSPPF